MRRASLIGRGRAGIGIAAAIVLAAMTQAAAAQRALPAGFVYLRDVDPTIAQDIRYAGSDNFVGRPLPGYEATECILRRDVAAALKRVQADLAASGLSLKVYDCYRPIRAVRHGGVGERRALRGRDQALLSEASKEFVVAGGLYRVTVAAFERDHNRSHADADCGRGARGLRPGGRLWALHRPARAAQSRQRRRHGHEFRLL